MKVYLVQVHEDGPAEVAGIAASIDAAANLAEEKVSDYFGQPIRWDTPYVGKYHLEPYNLRSVLVTEFELAT